MLKTSETKNNCTSSQTPIGRLQYLLARKYLSSHTVSPIDVRNCFFDKTMKFFSGRETERALYFGNALSFSFSVLNDFMGAIWRIEERGFLSFYHLTIIVPQSLVSILPPQKHPLNIYIV